MKNNIKEFYLDFLNGHSYIMVDTKKNIVYEKPSGIWQKDDFELFHKLYKEKVIPLLKGERFAICNNAVYYKISLIEEEIKKHNEWLAQNNLAKVVLVVGGHVEKREHLEEVKNNLEPKIVNTLQAAEEWLREQGF
ncbi:hypothetical protein [Tepidibacter hydrothermalis]|uniref:Uncharacterized protein n=1 Tax=Tepidibacter hydrothermalis TaxID=3036126 RepID=A0ABY8E6Z6_9FIRM|nr:hypothetical protein [Tepidibacter hydrothermalis]WFD08658.1 hypothetical protein P4S50_09615 [Tepidibacter hydrothermalis]